MEDRAVACTWEIHHNRGLETAWITLDGGRLAARGRAVGLAPEPYWVAYTLETGDRQVTRRLAVQVESAAGARSLELLRSVDGTWRADGATLADLSGALDCDLAFSLLTNTMPILRHQLHQHPGAARLAMAWVSLPDLAVHRSEQQYEHLRRTADGAVVRFSAGDFTADLEVDADGLVVRYPQLGSRVARAAAGGLHEEGATVTMGVEQEDGGGRQDQPSGAWLIDGMNLIGSRPDRWWNDPDRAVRRLIEALDRYASATGEVVTVVFDRQPAGVPPGPHGAILVAFASWRGRDAADHEIVRILAEERVPGSVRVVTSDRGLAERVRRLGAAVTSSTGFRRRMDQVLAAAP